MKKFFIFAVSVALILSFAGCEKKNAPSDSSDYTITVAKNRDGLDNGEALSSDDASSLLAQLASAEKESDWIDVVSNSIASCYIAIENAGERTLYQYCDTGTLDDITNMRSLTLGNAERGTVNDILSKYVDLKLQRANLTIPADIQLKP